MIRIRKIKFFLRDFYFFLILFDRNFSNIFNFIRAIIKKDSKFVFRRNDKYFEFRYLELIRSFEIIEKIYLISGKILTDVSDYKKFKINFKEKNVLDVGAWIGDSILLFHKLGAEKIIAYEPIKENVEFAKKLIKKFRINCKIYDYAVCKEDGEKEFLIEKEKYGKEDLILLEQNQNIHIYHELIPIKVKCISWKKVLENAIKEKVDIAKVDCEGCEKYLMDVEDELIKRIKEWIVEAHSKETVKDLIRKFNSCGFKLEKILPNEVNSSEFITVLYFTKK